jgi:hypothetical protein
MTTSATPLAAVCAAFSGLIDYAGLFPPAQLGMKTALAEYVAARRSPHAWMLARFILAASRIDELLQDAAGAPPPLSVIVDAGNDSRAWFGNAQGALARIATLKNSSSVPIEALEVPLSPLLSLRETYDAAIGQYAAAASQAELRDVPSFIELPRNDRWLALLPGALAAMQRHRLGAKLRCGGVTAASVPPVLDVATFLHLANEEGTAFKATAGLHHPIRGYNEQSGFIMHGFLNVLTAAALAKTGAALEDLIAVLEDEETSHFVFEDEALLWKGRTIPAELLKQTRERFFVAYGSCSFDEPVNDLAALGMLA